MAQHTIQEYEAELAELRQRLEDMTEVVYEMIADARRALENGDDELAQKTVRTDHIVNQQEVEIDQFCFDVLVRRQSVAGDLRFILAAIKMVTHVERIGDQAASICHEVVDNPGDIQSVAPEMITELADVSKEVVKKAIDAFLQEDADLAFEAIDSDDQVNEAYHRANRELLSRMANGDLCVETGSNVQGIAKRFERMADCATNIAEAIIFALEAQDIRHRDKLASTKT